MQRLPLYIILYARTELGDQFHLHPPQEVLHRQELEDRSSKASSTFLRLQESTYHTVGQRYNILQTCPFAALAQSNNIIIVGSSIPTKIDLPALQARAVPVLLEHLCHSRKTEAARADSEPARIDGRSEQACHMCPVGTKASRSDALRR